MILWNLDDLIRDPLFFLSQIAGVSIALLMGITVHEFSHALVATRLGDPTARQMGRLSLNPKAHLDPMGTLMLFLAGFGWGKPVPVNPAFLRNGRTGMSLVALAGPLSNLITAGVFALLIRLGTIAWHPPTRYATFDTPFAQLTLPWIVADIFGLIIFYNLILAVFNLIPLWPLDGYNVAMGVLPSGIAQPLARLAPYGPVVLMILIGLAYVTRINLLWGLLSPTISFLALILVGRPL